VKPVEVRSKLVDALGLDLIGPGRGCCNAGPHGTIHAAETGEDDR
jgi:hypothetical protein